MKFTIEIAVDFPKWKTIKEINIKLFKTTLKTIIEKYPNLKIIKEIELSILLANDLKIKTLNQEFRNKDKPTNVLSFPDIEIDFRKIFEFKPESLDYFYLGDIAFSLETMAHEAQENDIEFLDHFKHLLVHSILHLLGYDHENDADAEIMENLETELLKELEGK